MSSEATASQPVLANRRVGFIGKSGGIRRRDRSQLVRQHGGTPVEDLTEGVDLLVIGADELPWDAAGDLLSDELKKAIEEDRTEVISETELWERLGLLDEEIRSQTLYTPAMLAELLHVPIATVRRWHRRKLIVPVKEVHRLPYFDFQEVTNARRLANMIAAGITPAAIEKKLAALSNYVKGVERPLAQLSVIVEGRQILLRQDEGLIEPNGQLRFDFDLLEREPREEIVSNAPVPIVCFADYLAHQKPAPTCEEMLAAAAESEDHGQLLTAIELCRCALAAGGPRADVCFRLAELLYRAGDSTGARERYFMAIELDEDYVEARANLGCVLAETGELEMAIAAFEGALAIHADYADVHYHLARTLGELGRDQDAQRHWLEFLRLAPNSPWADEARIWLGATGVSK